MAAISDEDTATLMANAWFASLGAEVRADIISSARRLQLPAQAPLFLRGDAGNGWFALLRGSIRIGGTTSEGRLALLTFMAPGHWVGEMSLIDGGPRTHDAHAHLDSTLLQIAPADFQGLLQRHPALTLSLLRRRCGATRALLSLIEVTTTAPLESQLAARIVALAQGFGAGGEGGPLAIELHLSQELLAQLLGVSRARVNQILQAWERAGMVRHHYGRLVVLDMGALTAVAQDGAADLVASPTGNPMRAQAVAANA